MAEQQSKSIEKNKSIEKVKSIEKSKSIDKKSPHRLPEVKKSKRLPTPKQRASPSIRKLPSIERRVPNTPEFNKRIQFKQQLSPKKKSEVAESQEQLMKSPSLQIRIQSGQIRQSSERNFIVKKSIKDNNNEIKPFIRQQSSRPSFGNQMEGLFFSPKKQQKNQIVNQEEDILETIEEVESSPLTLTKSSLVRESNKQCNISLDNESNHSLEQKQRRNINKIIFKNPFRFNDELSIMIKQLQEIVQEDEYGNPLATMHQIQCSEQIQNLKSKLTSKLGRHYEEVYRQCKMVYRKSGDLGQCEMEQILSHRFQGVSSRKIAGIATLFVTLITQTQGEAINTILQ